MMTYRLFDKDLGVGQISRSLRVVHAVDFGRVGIRYQEKTVSELGVSAFRERWNVFPFQS
jgi:hypothetical protein